MMPFTRIPAGARPRKGVIQAGIFIRPLTNGRFVLFTIAVVLILASIAPAQTHSIDWYTLDAGGHMFSTGAGFELGGTIGQPDASSFSQPLSGGGFSLVGGFWPVAGAPACACPGDFAPPANVLDASDIQAFTTCFILGGTGCECADIDASGGLNAADVAAFVNRLLAGTTCP